jgi:hypothetical protein
MIVTRLLLYGILILMTVSISHADITTESAEPPPGQAKTEAPAPKAEQDAITDSEKLNKSLGDEDLKSGPDINELLKLPLEDPCLPSSYHDWQEVSRLSKEAGNQKTFTSFRIAINRADYDLVFEGIKRNGETEEIYSTKVGLGGDKTPTPEGRYLINHVYCYSDVMYFDQAAGPIQSLYDGFFAPLLICNESGKCIRYKELGIHGYQPPTKRAHIPDFGAVSAGCIRVPDPCKLKMEIVRAVGIGQLRHNDRGSYHWLNKPIEVVIGDRDPETDDSSGNLASLVQQGLDQVGEGIKGMLNIFGN